jgi:hypothetical protein
MPDAPPGRDLRLQAEWQRQAVTVRLYRQRHGITGPAPLGSPDDIRGLEHADQYRAARSALDLARRLSNQSHNQVLTRKNLPIDRRHRVDF